MKLMKYFAVLYIAQTVGIVCAAEPVCDSPPVAQLREITAPPAELELDPFYKKYISAHGYPIISSGKVDDYALREAAYLVE